ncbi:S9 family peptidase [Flaviaesturariibacter amylovorans]|uniref:S9 family peptidase n=1 Tax=Flaviaesturariibacter amylovorans TaxID=1084520 RepID=A0ABP8HRR3_9BACT
MKRFFYLFLLGGALSARAQDAVSYQQPPKAIADLLLARPTPLVSTDDKGQWMLLGERNSYPSVEELGQPELRLAGLRLNPNNFAPSRQTFLSGFKLKNIASGKEFPVTGLPAGLAASAPSWNAAGTRLAFLHTANDRVDLYMVDVATQKATRVNKQPLNSTLGSAFTWIDDATLLYKVATQPASAAPKKRALPKGPNVQQNIGKAAPSRTYQDLITSPHDEEVFAFYATSQLMQWRGGVETKIGTPGLYASLTPSPDKQYLLARALSRPFSYLVPAGGFPATVSILDRTGKTVKVIAELPSSESTPSGNDNTQNVPRSFDWRDDAPATVTWAMPLDSGLIRKQVPHHDAVYALSAPFTGAPQELFRTEMRYRGAQWGTRNVALVEEGLRGKQTTRVHVYDPSANNLRKLYDLSTLDAYNNPGNAVTHRNEYGRPVLQLVEGGSKLLFNNSSGSTPKGDLPFLATIDLKTGERKIVWRCPEGQYEYVADVLDAERLRVLTRRESQTMPPNFYLRDLKAGTEKALTAFANPYPGLEGVTKQKVSYQRADSVDLTGDLYLPKGYDPKRDGPLPVIIWAYPREYNNASDAAQVRGSQHRFTTVSWATPVFWVTQGYAVLDNAEMPIVGKGGKRPNDSFREQLVLNAEAAIGKLASMGVGDPKRVAVGGHSYGAFMTANLLAHTNLFRAGIARSGAYNRTLTPFGFQNEDRTYWQARELYTEMSPFTYADKIKTPLLLVHGELDDNPGTFPINSERLYNAVKGHGGTVRYVQLPYEAHSYRGRENLLHLMYEQHQWLEKYVKAPVPAAAPGEKQKATF